MNLALDADDRISGISFQPERKRSEEIKSFVFRLFSWQHLIWLPPFFLAGLLYSWLIQKTTKRAVGISTIGIHLYKGQNPCSLGRDKRSPAIQVSAHSKSRVDQRIRGKDADALDSSGTTF